ncbi:MAG: hypothetical protein NZM37_01500 [Sandaracinaceae bacterium]|nr:hypothetical protein [Sandaracinaceae bacterium]
MHAQVKRWIILLVFVGALGHAAAQVKVQGKRPDCVSVQASARFDGVGFSHWVILQNTCPWPVECQVSTNVAPSPTLARLAAGERKEINTFLSSPPSTFEAKVDCSQVVEKKMRRR